VLPSTTPIQASLGQTGSAERRRIKQIGLEQRNSEGDSGALNPARPPELATLLKSSATAGKTRVQPAGLASCPRSAARTQPFPFVRM